MNEERWAQLRVISRDCMVSSEGKIKSLEITITRKDGSVVTIEEKTRKPTIALNGYQVISLSGKTLYVHRLVMEAFYGDSKGLDVNHKNGIKHDNRLENLEYVTRKKNIRHSFDRGLHGSTVRPVIQVRISDGFHVALFPSIKKAENFTGIQSQNIGKVCLGKRKQAGGFWWEFFGK